MKINKKRLAKIAGVSRPTLDKALKNPKKYPNITLLAEGEENHLLTMQCVALSALHNDISPRDIESVLEFLGDNLFLSDKGKSFATYYWKLFIKN